MNISFCELKKKDVINLCDGSNLGNIYDISIDTCTGEILGIILPTGKGFFNIFKSSNDLFIPYTRICKIGKDIILVDIIMHNQCETDCHIQNQSTNQKNPSTNQNIDKIDIQTLLNKTFNNNN